MTIQIVLIKVIRPMYLVARKNWALDWSIGRWRVDRRVGCTVDREFVRVDAFRLCIFDFPYGAIDEADAAGTDATETAWVGSLDLHRMSDRM